MNKEQDPGMPSWMSSGEANETGNAAVAEPGRFGNALRNHRGLASITAIAVLAGGSVVGAREMLSDQDGDNPVKIGDMLRTEITDTTFDSECDAPAYEGKEHRELLGNSAFYPYDLSGTDAELLATFRNTLSRNVVGIAAADTLIKSYNAEVDFESLQKEINGELAVISDNDQLRGEACERVLAEQAVNMQRVTVTGSEFIEITPQYDGNSMLLPRVNFADVTAQTLFGDEGAIKGVWTDIRYGQGAVVITEDGRLFIVKTVNEEAADITQESAPTTIPADIMDESTAPTMPAGETSEDDESKAAEENDEQNNQQNNQNNNQNNQNNQNNNSTPSNGTLANNQGQGDQDGEAGNPGDDRGPSHNGPASSLPGPVDTAPGVTEGPTTTSSGPNTTRPATTVATTVAPTTTVRPTTTPAPTTTVKPTTTTAAPTTVPQTTAAPKGSVPPEECNENPFDNVPDCE